MRIFLAGTSFKKAYGGPAYSVARLASALAARGSDVALWAPDGSAVDAEVIGGDLLVHRLRGSLDGAIKTFARADVIHDNGLWRPHNHALARVARARDVPRIVSVRGMLEPWALKQKALKKKLAWHFYQRRDLAQAQCHHATADAEAANIRRLGLGVPVCVIPNGVDIPPLKALQNGFGSSPTALFISRIHPKKGLLMLIAAWARTRPNGWRLRIAGPDEGGHRGEVQAAIEEARLQDVITLEGPVDGQQKTEAFSSAQLFILPSHSENFGLVVAEALAHAVPVITTTATPWQRIADYNCGWCVTPNIGELAAALSAATRASSETLAAMGTRGREWMLGEFSWDDMARRFETLYENVVSA